MDESKNGKLRFAHRILVLCILMLCGYLLQGACHKLWKAGSPSLGHEALTELEKIQMPTVTYASRKRADNKDGKWMGDLLISCFVPGISYAGEEPAFHMSGEKADNGLGQEEAFLAGQAKEENAQAVEAQGEEQQKIQAQTPLDISLEKLRDFDYLLSSFYTVDSTTMVSQEDLQVDQLLSESMKLRTEEGPKVLIFHTHSQEAFADSAEGDPNTSIVGMGAYLTQLLNEKYGISTIHHDGVYDLVDGKMDRSSAYELAEVQVRKILEENPSIEVVIDLHRDGVSDTTHLITDVGEKPTARIMFFNGMSRTREQGDIPYLYNPYIQDNLAFSLQMQLACEQYYPGYARRIYIKGYRYNLHLMPKSLLIEAGAQTNTVEEMKNSMEVLADVLYHVLKE